MYQEELNKFLHGCITIISCNS